MGSKFCVILNEVKNLRSIEGATDDTVFGGCLQ